MGNLSKKPIVLVILDGYGFSHAEFGNAIWNAKTPCLDNFIKSHPHTLVNASGKAVGLPDGQIGNSEVGHLHIGAGRTVYTGLMLINNAIQAKQFWERDAFAKAVEHVQQNNSVLHVLGLLSPGGVHSHEEHIFEMLENIGPTGVQCVIHVFCDGRDVLPKSVEKSLANLQAILSKYPNIQLGSIAGRYYAMDRDKHWDRSMRYYDVLISGKSANQFTDVISYVESQYAKGITDEFIEPAVPSVKDPSKIALNDNDAVIFANFRPDRARQLSHLIFSSNVYDFTPPIRRKNLFFVTMMQYEGIKPSAVAFPPIILEKTFGEYISELGFSQLRIAETEKYAHVTFFFDGGHELVLPKCHKILIPSKNVATYDLCPEMSCIEIVDKLISVMKDFDFIIINFANPDMVGHTGNYEKTIAALEVLDQQLDRLFKEVNQLGGTIFLTADHGNAESMLTNEQKPITSHTKNPVYFVCSDNDISLTSGDLGNIAPTILDYAGLKIPAEMTKKSLIENKKR